MLKWDGSYLGRFEKTIIINQWKYNNKKAYELNINGNKFQCFAYLSDNLDQCIMDEIKILFKLNKIGTHYLHLGRSNKYFIILNPVVYINCNNINNDKVNITEIRKIYLYRLVVGLTHINDKNIVYLNDKYYSSKDYNIKFEKYELNKPILSKWFNEENIFDFSKKLFKIYNTKHLTKFINLFSIKIEEIIKTINPDYIYYKDIIINNLYTLLETQISNLTDDDYIDVYTPLKE